MRSLRSGSVLVLALLLLGSVSIALAQARTFTVGSGSRIQFVSEAPLETITGVTNAVSGQLTVDPANLSSARGTITVQVGTIRTGIDLRDQHLRSAGWLDAGRYPTATFEITGVSGASSLPNDQVVRLQLRGRLSLHGVTRDVTANAQVRYVPGENLIRGQASFEIQLSDYQVSISAPVRLKVSNTIRVNVTIRATAG